MQFEMANHFLIRCRQNCVFRRPFVWSCRYVSVRKTIFPQDGFGLRNQRSNFPCRRKAAVCPATRLSVSIPVWETGNRI